MAATTGVVATRGTGRLRAIGTRAGGEGEGMGAATGMSRGGATTKVGTGATEERRRREGMKKGVREADREVVMTIAATGEGVVTVAAEVEAEVEAEVGMEEDTVEGVLPVAGMTTETGTVEHHVTRVRAEEDMVAICRRAIAALPAEVTVVLLRGVDPPDVAARLPGWHELGVANSLFIVTL